MDQFNGADGALYVVGIDIHQHYFGADILYLAHDGIGGAGREADMGEDVSAHVRCLQTMLEHRHSLFVLG